MRRGRQTTGCVIADRDARTGKHCAAASRCRRTGNGWRFAPGHVAKLELVGQSVPAGRASAGAFTVTVTDLDLLLPVMEAPDGAGVRTPEPIMIGAGAEPPACPPRPLADCQEAAGSGAAKLDLVAATAKKPDRLLWKWKGSGDAAAPDLAGIAGGTGYTLCLYDGSDQLRLSAAAPTSGRCGGKACWKASHARARYADGKLERTGVRKLTIKAGARNVRIKAKGQGERLGLAELPLAGPITAQLVGDGSACYGSTFASGE